VTSEKRGEDAGGLPRRGEGRRRRDPRRAPAVRAGEGAGAQGRAGCGVRLLPPGQDPAAAGAVRRPRPASVGRGQVVPKATIDGPETEAMPHDRFFGPRESISM
jgi:hypothetical protein